MPDLPVVSGDGFVRALAVIGYELVRIRGSHMVLRRPGARQLVVPRHRELARGTLRILIKDAGLSVDEFIELLSGS